MSLVLRILHGVMAGLFGFSVIIQHNDPGPLPWMAIYAAAAFSCGWFAAGRPAIRWAGITAAIGMAWEIRYIMAGAWKTPFADLTREWHMTSEAIVDGREFYALLWIIGWMLLLIASDRMIKPSATS